MEQTDDFLSVLEDLGPILAEADPSDRFRLFLEALRDSFNWPVAECWQLSGSVYRLYCEAHKDLPILDWLAAESAKSQVATDWLDKAGWNRLPTEPPPLRRKVFWVSETEGAKGVARPELILGAGLHTLVLIPIPNGTPTQFYIIVRDFPPRDRDETQAHALAVAAYLFGRLIPPSTDETPPMPAVSADGRTRLDPASRCLVGLRGSERLTVYEWDLLSLLIERQDQALSFSELTQEVWRAPEQYVGRAAIYEIVARVRKHLSNVDAHDYELKSLPGFGYVLLRSKPL